MFIPLSPIFHNSQLTPLTSELLAAGAKRECVKGGKRGGKKGGGKEGEKEREEEREKERRKEEEIQCNDGLLLVV